MSNTNSFTGVEELYNSIKPVNGSATPKSLDVRPISDRKRKYERVAKIADDCYALSDGTWDWFRCRVQKHTVSDVPQLEDVAPIVWCRSSDGTETVTVRLSTGRVTPSRKRFLRWYLPTGISYVSGSERGGKYILSRYKGVETRHWLPLMVDKYNSAAALTFKRTPDGFILVSDPHYRELIRVNKEVKQPYVTAVKEFTQWLYAMLPFLLPTEPDRASSTWYHRRITTANLVKELADEASVRYQFADNAMQSLIRDIICSPEDEMRVALGRYLIARTNYEGAERYFKSNMSYWKSTISLNMDDSRRRTGEWVKERIEADTRKFLLSRKAAFRGALNELAGFTHSVEIK